MLHSVRNLEGFEIAATDGDLGSVKGFYFDDESWDIHYLILDTRRWLPGRTVIISTQALIDFDIPNSRIRVNLSKDKIKNSPVVDEDKPLSRHSLTQINDYYNWAEIVSQRITIPEMHLRSTHEVVGNYIHAVDGDVGHVEDFILDDQDWVIRYMVVDTRNWWPGKKVLVSPQWVESINWHESKVYVDVSREKIKSSPEFGPNMVPSRDYEEKLFGHYGRTGYWIRPTAGSPEGFVHGERSEV